MKRNPLTHLPLIALGGAIVTLALTGCASTQRDSRSAPPVSKPVAAAQTSAETPADINVARADELKAEGRQHMANAEWRAARDAFRLAIHANPLDEEAINGYDLTLAMMDEGSSMNRVANEYALRRQQTILMYDAAVASAYDALGHDDLGGAVRRLLEARAQLVRNEDVLRTDEYDARLYAVNAALERLDKAQELKRLTARNGD